jgi:hypothetical protein
MRRKDVGQFLQDVIGFAKVVRASVGKSGSVELSIEAHADDASKDSCEWWGHPAISCQPAAGSESLFVDLGSERIVIGVKERRWQVSVEAGECIVRALGPSPAAYLKLKPDGTAELHATRIDLGGEALTTFMARADRVDAEIKRIWTLLTTWVPVPQDGGAALKTAANAAKGGVLPTAADKVRGS